MALSWWVGCGRKNNAACMSVAHPVCCSVITFLSLLLQAAPFQETRADVKTHAERARSYGVSKQTLGLATIASLKFYLQTCMPANIIPAQANLCVPKLISVIEDQGSRALCIRRRPPPRF